MVGKEIYISRVNWTIIVCKAPNITMIWPAVLCRGCRGLSRSPSTPSPNKAESSHAMPK